MSPSRRRLYIAGAAALVAALSVALLVAYVNGQPAASSSRGPAVSTTPAVVALTDLPAGTKLSTANVGLAAYPSSALPSGAVGSYFTTLTQLLAATEYVSTALPRGTLILSTLLVAQPTGPPVTEAPIDITNAGDVAIAIPYGETTGAGGYVQAEDHIDILVDDATGTVQYAFQDVRVIKVGGRAEQSTVVGTATLLLIELPREQAATLAYLEDHGATIRYAIRPHDEFGKGPLPNSNPVNGSNWTTFLSR